MRAALPLGSTQVNWHAREKQLARQSARRASACRIAQHSTDRHSTAQHRAASPSPDARRSARARRARVALARERETESALSEQLALSGAARGSACAWFGGRQWRRKTAHDALGAAKRAVTRRGGRARA
eukprot:3202284-Pleurochrysis_carterae.AAC.1